MKNRIGQGVGSAQEPKRPEPRVSADDPQNQIGNSAVQEDPSWLERLWGMMTDNAVGGTGGAASDMLQNGSKYPLLNAGSSPVADTLGRAGAGKSASSAAEFGGGALSILGLVGGGIQAVQGIEELANGETGNGILDTLAGVGSFVSGAVGTSSLAGSGTGLGAAAIGGTGVTGLGTAVGAAGAGPIAASVGGGLAGGITLGMTGNDWVSDSDNGALLGRNADGSGRSWSDLSADAGTGAYEWAREAGAPEELAHVAGAGATLGTSMASVLPAAATGFAGLATGAYSLLTGW